MKATYVSVWDDEDDVRTSCLYDPVTKIVSDIKTAEEPPGACCLTDEYIITEEGDVIGRVYFKLEDEE